MKFIKLPEFIKGSDIDANGVNNGVNEYNNNLYEICCYICGDIIVVDKEIINMINKSFITCPNCNEILEFKIII